MSSSEDDDIPLKDLAKGKRSRPKDDDSSEAEFDDEASDGEPAEEEDADDFIVEDEDEDDEDGDYDSDDSDDIPLSKLKSPPKKKAAKKPAAKSKATKAKAAPKKKATSAKKKKPAAKKAASKPSAASSAYVSASTELYANCDKGKLIQSLLARWWYVYTWPEPSTIPSSTPKGYDALDGFPGVYICTSGENVGKFKDCRNHKTSPSFKNLSKKTSEELRNDLVKAIEKQKAALIKTEGEGTKTEKDLKDLQKWATKLNCSKADKDATKVLKAARLTV